MPGTSFSWGSMVRVDSCLAAAATILAAWALLRAAPWTVDDAFIVARYADNWVHHGVLSFNVAGPRVEGFTSPLFVALAALATLLGGSSLAAMKALGAACYLALAPTVLLLGRALRVHPLATGVVALVMVALPEHVTHALGGLETEAFVLGSVLALATFVRARHGRPRELWLFAASATWLALTRPEGIAIGASLALSLAWGRGTTPGGLVRPLGLGFVLPVLSLTLARLAYFGSLLPNPYYAKRGALNARHASDLVELGLTCFLDVLLWALAIALLARVSGRRSTRLVRRERLALGGAALCLGVCAVGYARAELVMNYSHRFAVHTLPWLLPPVLVLLSRGVSALGRLRSSRGAGVWALAAAALVLVSFTLRAVTMDRKQRSQRYVYSQVIERIHVPVARWIEANTAATATLAVYPDAGFIPYTTRRPVIDFGRLNDEFLARHAKTDADVVRYFHERVPDVAVLHFDEDGAPYDSGAAALLADQGFRQRYELVASEGDPRGSTLRVFARRP